MDIATLEGKSIIGNQEPGGLTEVAVRNMLLLPAEAPAEPADLLLGLGGRRSRWATTTTTSTPGSKVLHHGQVRTSMTLKQENGDVVCDRCVVAASPVLPHEEMLLGRSELGPGEGLLLRPASAIHTFFTRFPIDAVFLDREWRVVGIFSDVHPLARAARDRGAKAVLELPAG